MIFNLDLYEKNVASRHAQIQHEMQQIRMLAHLRKRRTFMQSVVARLGRVLIVLGSYMQHAGQQNQTPLTLKVDTPNP